MEIAARLRTWDERRWDRVALVAIAVGLALRLLWCLLVHPPSEHVFSDMQGYVQRATGLASGAHQNRFDAFYPPGTHIVLALPLKLFGVHDLGAANVWWALLSSVTPFFAWRLARVLLGPVAGALTAVFAALYPLHIFYAGFFSSETPSLAFLAGGLWLAYRARAAAGARAIAWGAAGGVLAGIAIANRPQYVINVAIVALPLVWRWRRHWRPAVGLAVTGVLTVGAFLAYNSAAAGKLTGISENSASVFYQGHCPVRLLSGGTPKDGSLAFGNPVNYQLNRKGPDVSFYPNHALWDQGFLFSEGWKCIRRDGPQHVLILARNLADTTVVATPWPVGTEIAMGRATEVTNITYCMGLLFGILPLAVLLVRRRRREGEDAWGVRQVLWQLLSIVPVAMLFASEPRYRVPYDIFGLMLLAAILADRLARPAPVPRRSGTLPDRVPGTVESPAPAA